MKSVGERRKANNVALWGYVQCRANVTGGLSGMYYKVVKGMGVLVCTLNGTSPVDQGGRGWRLGLLDGIGEYSRAYASHQ